MDSFRSSGVTNRNESEGIELLNDTGSFTEYWTNDLTIPEKKLIKN